MHESALFGIVLLALSYMLFESIGKSLKSTPTNAITPSDIVNLMLVILVAWIAWVGASNLIYDLARTIAGAVR